MKPRLTLRCAIVLFCCASPSFSHAVDWQKTLEKGNHELAVGNTENAVAIFSKEVKKYPSSGQCHTALGRAYKRLGKISDAKSEFHDSTQLDPAYADAFYELGVVQESDQNWKDAVSSFETYLRLKPDASERQALSDRIIFCKNHADK